MIITLSFPHNIKVKLQKPENSQLTSVKLSHTSFFGLSSETWDRHKKDYFRSQTVIWYNFGLIFSRSQKYKNQIIYSKKYTLIKFYNNVTSSRFKFIFQKNWIFFCLFYTRNKILQTILTFCWNYGLTICMFFKDWNCRCPRT